MEAKKTGEKPGAEKPAKPSEKTKKTALISQHPTGEELDLRFCPFK